MGNKSFDFKLDITIVSVISRPELNRYYKINDISFAGIFSNLSNNLEAAFPDKYFYVKTGIEMKFHTSRNKSRSVGYHFKYHYMKAGKGNPYQNVEHSVSYKFMFLP